MVCNEPLRPGQRLEPDCPEFFTVSIANPANAETVFCFALLAALQRPQSVFSAVLDHFTAEARGASTGFLRPPIAVCR